MDGTRATTQSRAGASLLALSVAVLVAGCGFMLAGDDRWDDRGIVIKNGTDVPVTIRMIVDGGELDVWRSPLAPGNTAVPFLAFASSNSMIQDECTIGDLVAYDSDGVEVARISPPLCYDDPMPQWTIVRAEPSPTP